tara:strand:+ start:3139 stop:3576 length:438 start_codon:yes stop_codon:yes gene_type:complete
MKSTKQVEVNCSVEFLWEVLTKPEYTKLYMFNCAVSTNWEVGSDIIWKGFFNGFDTHQKGKVISIYKNKKLSYSLFDINTDLEDIPENYIIVSYTLHDFNGMAHLTITNETFDGSTKRMSHLKQGWDIIIGKLKEIAEEESTILL